MPTNKKDKPKKKQVNNNLPTLYVDDVDMARREDGVNYLSFTTNIPDYIVEQVRFIVDDAHLRDIIEYLCEATNFYPKKPAKTKKVKKSRTK